MQILSFALALAAAGFAAAAPSPVATAMPDKVIQARAPLATNPFSGKSFYANEFYASEVHSAASVIAATDSALAAKASKVADIGTFMWIDTIAKIPTIKEHLSKVPSGSVMGLVVYDLPDRDCAALASNGELHNTDGGLARYKTEYIDGFREALLAYPDVSVVLVIEPDSLPNLITNIDESRCKAAEAGYMEGTVYALKQLNLPNVAMYLDAGHGGWLGWDENLKPGAAIFGKVYKDAGSPSQVRGLAINVANWNAFDLNPGEFEDAADAKYNSAQDEKRYAHLLAPQLESAGFPAHFIMDTGRNAVQGLREEWGNWCNIKGTGFGVRPTTSTGDSLFDAFVWIKPGGESDGTSDSSADRYDANCGKSDSDKPAPQAGQWFQSYFETLVKNAKPSL
ncbi:exoglucanase 3 precursor [Peziza echinospora]|nr:exoglucanase 3 precursor [Peziza echinospora]